MNRTHRRARAIAIAQTRDNAKLLAARLLMLATGATAACIAYLAIRGFWLKPPHCSSPPSSGGAASRI